MSKVSHTSTASAETDTGTLIHLEVAHVSVHSIRAAPGDSQVCCLVCRPEPSFLFLLPLAAKPLPQAPPWYQNQALFSQILVTSN